MLLLAHCVLGTHPKYSVANINKTTKCATTNAPITNTNTVATTSHSHRHKQMFGLLLLCCLRMKAILKCITLWKVLQTDTQTGLRNIFNPKCIIWFLEPCIRMKREHNKALASNTTAAARAAKHCDCSKSAFESDVRTAAQNKSAHIVFQLFRLSPSPLSVMGVDEESAETKKT